MPAVTIRRAEAADAALLSALNADVQAVHAEGMPDRFKPPAAGTFPVSSITHLLAKPETLMFLGFMAAAPAGYLYAEVMRLPETAVRYAAPLLYVHHIGVRPAFRAMGVGKALINTARSAAEDLGITRLGLDVWTFNKSARSFFQSQGFVAVREVLYQG